MEGASEDKMWQAPPQENIVRAGIKLERDWLVAEGGDPKPLLLLPDALESGPPKIGLELLRRR